MLQQWENADHDLGLIQELYSTFFGFLLHYHGDFLKGSYEIR